ncbi:hypothetical protein DSM106972_073450 [Dulcicalothrix desertica PCC 7102]|uniref:Uncharacterized protein n=1 Tax=Dulcicalothrix desertica PCC 7102 TaxID=232991 RepID=A0A3S1CFM6_9CYAN|nr:hypothetical protein DSM106972_073450 [Dulcicalothrix desertica PCC 7102]TWH53281.1 hypothetical protein CAL7102_01226 [Dulcicalothrix desertica PCC 7102]
MCKISLSNRFDFNILLTFYSKGFTCIFREIFIQYLSIEIDKDLKKAMIIKKQAFRGL